MTSLAYIMFVLALVLILAAPASAGWDRLFIEGTGSHLWMDGVDSDGDFDMTAPGIDSIAVRET